MEEMYDELEKYKLSSKEFEDLVARDINRVKSNKKVEAIRTGGNLSKADVKLKIDNTATIHIEVKKVKPSDKNLPPFFNDRFNIINDVFTAANKKSDVAKTISTLLNKSGSTAKDFVEAYKEAINANATKQITSLTHYSRKNNGHIDDIKDAVATRMMYRSLIKTNKLDTSFSTYKNTGPGKPYNQYIYVNENYYFDHLIKLKMAEKKSPYLQIGNELYMVSGLPRNYYYDFGVNIPILQGIKGTLFVGWSQNSGRLEIMPRMTILKSTLPGSNYSFIKSKGKINPLTNEKW